MARLSFPMSILSTAAVLLLLPLDQKDPEKQYWLGNAANPCRDWVRLPALERGGPHNPKRTLRREQDLRVRACERPHRENRKRSTAESTVGRRTRETRGMVHVRTLCASRPIESQAGGNLFHSPR